MEWLYVVVPVGILILVLAILYRRSRPKYEPSAYPVEGMWDLILTSTKVPKTTPLDQLVWFKSQAEAHHAGDLMAAMDRAFNRIQNDMPRTWVKGRSGQDYMAMIVSDTFPASTGAPSLKVTPVPPNLKGTIYDKGGFLLAGGATFLPPKFTPALMVLPNITSVEHIGAIENGFKHEEEHVVVHANDPQLHAGLAWFEQHPFLPLTTDRKSLIENAIKTDDHIVMRRNAEGVWVMIEAPDDTLSADRLTEQVAASLAYSEVAIIHLTK